MMSRCGRDILLGAAALGLLLGAAALGLGYAGAFGPEVQELAASKAPADRLRAAETARAQRGDTGVDILARLARDADRSVAAEAVWALGGRDSDNSRSVLHALLTDANVPAETRAEAAAGLGRCDHLDPRLLTEVLAGEPDAAVRAGAAKGLLRVAQRQETLEEARRIIPQLSASLDDPSPRVRALASMAIQRLIVRRFPFDPQAPPETRQRQAEVLREYLRKCGAL